MTTYLRAFTLLFALSLALLLATASQAARDAVITLKDGRTIKGEIVEESDKSITVLISGIKTPYSRDLIKGIEFVKTTEEEFAEKRAKIADDNITERYELARWLFNKKSYDLAKKELDDLAKRDPKNAEVKLLKQIVDGRLKETPSTTPGTPVTPGTPDAPVTPDTPPTAAGDLPKDRLNQKQINRIRVLEINEETTPPPRVTIPRNVLDDFLKKYSDNELIPKGGTDRNRFYAKKDLEKLKLIMEIGAREYYDDVVSHDDPPAIRDFRNIHKNYVMSFCATNECHGGHKAGKFFLFATNPTANETIHTNFYILTQTRPKAGYMVDRDFPGRSLLIHYGLPRDKTTTPHPDVPGFKPPMILLDKDRTYQLLVEWISKSLYRPEPKYELNYKLPSLAPAAADPKTPTTPAPAVPKAE